MEAKDVIRKKAKLSRNEYREYCCLVSELRDVGVITGTALTEAEAPRKEILIEQVGAMIESQVFRLARGQVGYMMSIAVTNQSQRGVDVIAVELRTNWEQRFFQWLQPVSLGPSASRAKKEPTRDVYRFPGTEVWYERNQVINERLLESRRLPAKRRLEGVLLAIGSDIPFQLINTESEEVTLAITTVDCEESAKLQLWIDRTELPEKSMPRRKLFPKPKEEVITPTQESVLEPASQLEAESAAIEILVPRVGRDI
jgi:hypothetical protein